MESRDRIGGHRHALPLVSSVSQHLHLNSRFPISYCHRMFSVFFLPFPVAVNSKVTSSAAHVLPLSSSFSFPLMHGKRAEGAANGRKVETSVPFSCRELCLLLSGS